MRILLVGSALLGIASGGLAGGIGLSLGVCLIDGVCGLLELGDLAADGIEVVLVEGFLDLVADLQGLLLGLVIDRMLLVVDLAIDRVDELLGLVSRVGILLSLVVGFLVGLGFLDHTVDLFLGKA